MILPPNIVIAAMEVLGGADVLDAPAKSQEGLIVLVRNGLPEACAETIVRSGLAISELHHLVAKDHGLDRAMKVGVLSQHQSDRLARIAILIAKARETFGSEEKAAHWLRRPTDVFNGDAPMFHADTTFGWSTVLAHLAKIDWGDTA